MAITKQVPMGKPLDLTEEQLDVLAEITPADIERAKIFWRQHVPEEFQDLLDAEPTEEGGA